MGKIKQTMFWLLFLLVGTWAAAEYRWTNVNIGGGGFVSAVIPSQIEEGVIYARTDVGGAYRWNETSKRWESMMDWVSADERGLLGIEALAVDPTTPGTVYMMAGTVYWNQAADGIGRSAFLRSTNYGQSWDVIYTWDDNTKWFNVHGNGMGRGNGERLAVDPANSKNIFYGTRNKGLWKSSDQGNTWAKVSSFPVDTTWNGAGISFVQYAPDKKIYVGVLREGANLYMSADQGATWQEFTGRPVEPYAKRLMPQRIAVTSDSKTLYITFGDGAGPHTMQWDEGWGPIEDWFNRGAVYKVNVATKTWTDISPQDFIRGDGEEKAKDPSNYFGNYSGVSVDPQNPNMLVVSSIASYRGTQYWNIGGTWKDFWGDNIFVSTDGGANWTPSFQYYWVEGGQEITVEQMKHNGNPWIVGNTIHWIGSVAIDPFNPKRVFVTSGNGIFRTENILNYEYVKVDDWSDYQELKQKTEWKFSAQGIEETVPEDLVSIENGPMISVIYDYDGFIHEDVRISPPTGRHLAEVSGELRGLGSTSGLAMAAKTGKLVKVTRTREVELQYNTVPIGPLQYSNDTGKTWQVEGYITNPPVNLNAGKVALSANGTTTLWMPEQGTTMYRHSSSNWSTVSGINFWARPIADPENDKVFYAFNKATGEMYVSSDGGISFAKSGTASPSNFGTVRAVPKKTGDIWVPVATVSESGVRSGKLMRSQDGGKTFSTISGVGYCEAVGFGKAAPNKTFPAIYVYAQIDNKLGVYQSIDEGVTWAWVNDDAHQYGGLANGEFVIGDMNTFGVVYMSTAGRGIAVRIPAEWDEYPVINKPANVVQPSHYSITRKASQLHIKTTGTPVNVRLINTKGEQLFNQNFERSSVVDLRHLNLPSGTLFIQGRAQGKVIWQNSMFWN